MRIKRITDLILKTRLVLFIFIAVTVFQSCKNEKKDDRKDSFDLHPEIVKEKKSPYTKLLDLKPVYKDSIYSIYISTISKQDKILFLAQGQLSDIQKESKFFVHVYPFDESLLGENKLGNLNYDFNSNFKTFRHLGVDYHISETSLPNLDIKKINLGQYGFRGDGKINWSINKILKIEEMQPILNENKDYISLNILN